MDIEAHLLHQWGLHLQEYLLRRLQEYQLRRLQEYQLRHLREYQLHLLQEDYQRGSLVHHLLEDDQ